LKKKFGIDPSSHFREKRKTAQLPTHSNSENGAEATRIIS